MTSVLIIQAPDRPDSSTPALAVDFAAAGFSVLGPVGSTDLVREAVRARPNAVVCWAPRPDEALTQAIATLQAQQPTPVLVFTHDASVEAMQRALAAGVHAWVVQGYAPQRLRPLVHLAQAREAHERGLRESLAALSARFEERKLVDKAKGILMQASQVSEDEAFRLLRSASMQGNQRVGDVSRQVIDAAQVAEAINRAGQQRMLSQRLVKLYALLCLRCDPAAAALTMRQSIQRAHDNLGALEKSLSAASYGDLLRGARAGWLALRQVLDRPPDARHLAELDRLADTMLAGADALVQALEHSGLAATVRVINLSGRQRMLSQRLAKQALLGAAAAELQASTRAFDEGMVALRQAPLSTPEIGELLASAQQAWAELGEGVARVQDDTGRLRIAAASEELLALFDRLTGAYQRSIQVLMG